MTLAANTPPAPASAVDIRHHWQLSSRLLVGIGGTQTKLGPKVEVVIETACIT